MTQGRLKLLIGTDAASTGLNLQRLGCLINLDLPWNPTILEQRKGRVQRGTLAKRIPFYNMRYDQAAEQKLFETLNTRIQEVTAIFGTIPDFIVDQWVTDMLEDKAWDENTVLQIIEVRQQNPFTLKETTESLDTAARPSGSGNGRLCLAPQPGQQLCQRGCRGVSLFRRCARGGVVAPPARRVCLRRLALRCSFPPRQPRSRPPRRGSLN